MLLQSYILYRLLDQEVEIFVKENYLKIFVGARD